MHKLKQMILEPGLVTFTVAPSSQETDQESTAPRTHTTYRSTSFIRSGLSLLWLFCTLFSNTM